MEQMRMCMRKRVTEKSKHFFDFSTMKTRRMDPKIEDIKIAALSTQPMALHTSKYFAVNIRSTVTVVANKTWFI